MGVILDTSIWVAVERGRLTPAEVEAVIGKDPVYLSPVTLAELEYGVQRAPDSHSRIKRQGGAGPRPLETLFDNGLGHGRTGWTSPGKT